MNAKIVVIRNGEEFVEFPMAELPSGFSEQKHEERKTVIEKGVKLVKDKTQHVIKNLNNVQFYVQIPSRGNRVPLEGGLAKVKSNELISR